MKALLEVRVEFYVIMKSVCVCENRMFSAKNQLKASILLDGESGSRALSNIGVQAVITGAVKTPSQLAAAVDAISPADVKAVCYFNFFF